MDSTRGSGWSSSAARASSVGSVTPTSMLITPRASKPTSVAASAAPLRITVAVAISSTTDTATWLATST